jgi:Zn-dependent protease with chaperone function
MRMIRMMTALAAVLLLAASTALAAAPVAVPPATQAGIAYTHMHEWIWALVHLVGLAVPAVLLFSGLGARLRSACSRLARANRYGTLTLFAAAYFVIAAVCVMPLDYWHDVALEHAFGRPGEALAVWLAGELVSLAVTTIAAALFLWIPYGLMRRSPRWWWLAAALALVPVAFVVLVALPVFVDPLTTTYTPLANPALAAKIEALAARCGVPAIPIYVGGDDDTVVGLGPTNRIILEDRIEKVETPDQITGTIGHELKHYVMGDNYKALAIIAAVLLSGFWLVDRIGRWAMLRWDFGFRELCDPASLPLIALVLSLFWLAVLPAFNWEARSIEHEADRFGLELTHENRANAELFAGWVRAGQTPDDDWFSVTFRATHPSLAERIRFANTYRPWERGEKLVYANVCRPAG